MSNVKVVINPQGVRAILKSDAVKADLKRRAALIHAKAGGGGYTIDERESPNRARVEVSAVSVAARQAESENGNLRRALGG